MKDRKNKYLFSIQQLITLWHLTVQIIGYAARVAAHSDKESIPIYSIQTILILLAPPLYAASIYMVLGRIISYVHAEHFSLVPLKWMTGIFVTGDVVAFVMQAAGWCMLLHKT